MKSLRYIVVQWVSGILGKKPLGGGAFKKKNKKYPPPPKILGGGG
jgi:hypothetical protein